MVDAIFPPGANGKDNKQAEAIKKKLNVGGKYLAKGADAGTDVGTGLAKRLSITKFY